MHFRRMAATGLLGLGALATPLVAVGHTHAQATVCRTDPKIYLSSGVEVDLSAGQSGAVGQVSNIEYDVHVPAGVTVKRVVSTGGTYANKETFKVYTDDTAGSYDATVTVYSTSAPTMTSAAQMSVKGVTTATLYGMVNYPIYLHVSA